ncbi:MAG: Uma2 family endonuclease [Geodermatophilaceae bacterium]|jgi:hypothetical protein|nr:Uma2 family endonuclease [Geodermatophilaceae bacterium]
MGRTVLLGEPPNVLAEWLERRRALGQDRFDEVWEGDYHVSPEARASHGDVQDQVSGRLRPLARQRRLWPSGPVNIGTPDNFRVPDLVLLRQRSDAVFLSTAAIVVEVVSPGDESYRKFAFYFAQGVEEVLMVDPVKRSVQWHARGVAAFERAAASAVLELSGQALGAGIDWPPTAE